jgi:hypothetical protein
MYPARDFSAPWSLNYMNKHVVLLAFSTLLCVIFVSCSGIPAVEDAWHPKVPDSKNGILYFDWQTGWFPTEDEAKTAAINYVNVSVARYCLQYITGYTEDKTFYTVISNKTLEDGESFSDVSQGYTDVLLSQIEISKIVTQRYINEQRQNGWRAWALAKVSEEQAREETKNNTERIKSHYSNWMEEAAGKADMFDALRTYESIYDALKANGLHQALTGHLYDDIPGLIKELKNSIPVDIRVAGDVDGRFRAVFAKAFTNLGFLTGSDNSRFILELTVNLEPALRNSYFNTFYTINAVLKDTRNKSELFTYNIADRESHPLSQAEANNRAVIVALRRIEEEFFEILKEHLGLP